MKKLLTGLLILISVLSLAVLVLFFLITEPRNPDAAQAAMVPTCPVSSDASASVFELPIPAISKHIESKGLLHHRHLNLQANQSHLTATLDVTLNSGKTGRLVRVTLQGTPTHLYDLLNIELLGRPVSNAVKTYLIDKYLFGNPQIGDELLNVAGLASVHYTGNSLCFTLNKTQEQAQTDIARWLIEKDQSAAAMSFYANEIAVNQDANDLELLVRRLLVFADIRAKTGSSFEHESSALISALAAATLKTHLQVAKKPIPDYLTHHSSIKALQLQGRSDFASHFVFSTLLSAKVSPHFAGLVGEIKEFQDAYQGSGFSFKDLTVNYAAIKFTQRILSCSQNTRGSGVATVLDKGFLPNLSEFDEFLTLHGNNKISIDQLLNRYLRTRGKLIASVDLFYQIDRFCS